MKKSGNVLKLILFILFFTYPSFLYAHGGEIVLLALYSFSYFLFSGLIIGLVETEFFRKYSDSKIVLGKIILYNYIILTFSYFVLLFFIIINDNFTNAPIDSANLMLAMRYDRMIAIFKLLLSIFVYLGLVIGLKYFIYRKKIFLEPSEENALFLIMIPNLVLLGLFFCLTFENFVWHFGG